MELWNGTKPSLCHFCIWGYPTHVLKGKIEKLESRIEVCMFVGYSKETKGGIFYSPKDNKTFVSTNATFLEHDYINNHKPQSKVVLEEMVSNKQDQSPAVENENWPEDIASYSQNNGELHRSGRVGPYEHEAQMLVSDTNKDYPLTYRDAMEDSDKEK